MPLQYATMRNMYPILEAGKCLASTKIHIKISLDAARFIRSPVQNIRHKSETFLPATAIK